MDEATTSAETVTETPAADAAQAEDTTQTAPEATDKETTTEPEADKQEVEDEDLKWLKSKGIDPSDSKAVAQAYRKAEQEFHKDRQAEKKTSLTTQARAAVTEDDNSELVNEVRQLRVAQQVTEFRAGLREQGFNKDQIDEIDASMAKLVETKTYLAHDLDALYALTRTSKFDAELKAAEDRGRQQAKESVAKQSTAKAPAGSAKSKGEAPKKEDDFLKGFNNPW